VGEDLDAGPLWLDYVTFLKKSEAAHVSPDAKVGHTRGVSRVVQVDPKLKPSRTRLV